MFVLGCFFLLAVRFCTGSLSLLFIFKLATCSGRSVLWSLSWKWLPTSSSPVVALMLMLYKLLYSYFGLLPWLVAVAVCFLGVSLFLAVCSLCSVLVLTLWFMAITPHLCVTISMLSKAIIWYVEIMVEAKFESRENHLFWLVLALWQHLDWHYWCMKWDPVFRIWLQTSFCSLFHGESWCHFLLAHCCRLWVSLIMWLSPVI